MLSRRWTSGLAGVELEGLEPSSKRGAGGLSTCVFFDWFSCCARPKTAKRGLILWIFGGGIEACLRLFPNSYTTGSVNLGKGITGWCPVFATVAKIKLIYCTSIRQRERSCFRHLNFLMPWLKRRTSCLCTLTHHFYTLSKPVNPI